MNKHLVILVFLLLGIFSYSQSPQKFTYQSIVRSADGKILKSNPIGIKLSVLRNSVNGMIVYSETHDASTNPNGLVTLIIGEGSTSQLFSEIDWSNGEYFLRVEIDPLGGIDYSIEQSSQLLSVPYALYAANASNVDLDKNVEGILPVSSGGTGSTTAPFIGVVTAPSAEIARQILGINSNNFGGDGTKLVLTTVENNYLSLKDSAVNDDEQELSAGIVPISLGGTGSSTAPMVGLVTAANAADARSVIGTGSIATQNIDAVDVDGGAIDGTVIGASAPSTGIFTSVNSGLIQSVGDTDIIIKTGNNTTGTITLANGADGDIKIIPNGVGKVSVGAITFPASDGTVNQTLSTDGNGSLSWADVQSLDSQLSDLAGLEVTDGNIIVGDGTNFVAESGATARTSLGLGSIATQNIDAVDVDGGAIDGTIIGASAPSTGIFTSVNSGLIQSVGDTDIIIKTGNNTTGTITLANGADGDIKIIPNGTGKVTVGDIIFPASDGTANQILKTDGSGNLSFTDQNVSTPVTLATVTDNYLTLEGQEITSGIVPIALGGTNSNTAPMVGVITAADAAAARTVLGVDASGTDSSTSVTLATVTDNYLTLEGQEITSGIVPIALGGTNSATAPMVGVITAADAAEARTAIGTGSIATQNSDAVDVDGGAIDGTVIGATAPSTGIFTSVNSGLIQSVGDTDIIIKTGNNNTGTITLNNGSNGNINISPNGTGKVVMDNVIVGATDGNQVIDIASHDLVDGGLKLGGTLVTSSAAELNVLDGVTSSAAELNVLDGVTSTSTELNYNDITTLGNSENSKVVTQSSAGVITIGATDGDQVIDIASHDLVDGGLKLGGTLVTSSAAELNVLDGVTATTAELNLIAGVTSSVAELNVLDGSTTQSTLTLQGPDGIIISDSSDSEIMKQALVSDLATYIGSGASALGELSDVTNPVEDSFYLGQKPSQYTITDTDSRQNVAIGLFAMRYIDDVDSSIAIGYDTMIGTNGQFTGDENIGIGKSAMRVITSGSDNTAVGVDALLANTSGSNNISIGNESLSSNTQGGRNTAVGFKAMYLNQTGERNAAFGYASGKSGSQNASFGAYGLTAVTGSNNTTLGYYAGAGSGSNNAITSGTNNVVIGHNSGVEEADAVNRIVIGKDASGLDDNTVTLGNTDITAWVPADDGGVDLGSSSKEMKDIYVDGIAYIDALDFGGSPLALPGSTGSNGNILKNNGDGTLAWTTNVSGASDIGTLSDVLIEDNSIYIGHDPVSNTSTAQYNVSVGVTALDAITSGDENTAMGYKALSALSSGSANTAIGKEALSLNNGSRNTALGYLALWKNTSGNDNNAFGENALRENQGGSNNTAIGDNALESNKQSNNTAVGSLAMKGPGSNDDSNNSTALGYKAGYASNDGDNNVFIGYQAGDAVTSGDNNIIIGADSAASAVTADNQIVIGKTATGIGNNKAVIGNASVTDVYMAQDGEAIVHAASIAFSDGTSQTTASSASVASTIISPRDFDFDGAWPSSNMTKVWNSESHYAPAIKFGDGGWSQYNFIIPIPNGYTPNGSNVTIKVLYHTTSTTGNITWAVGRKPIDLGESVGQGMNGTDFSFSPSSGSKVLMEGTASYSIPTGTRLLHFYMGRKNEDANTGDLYVYGIEIIW